MPISDLDCLQIPVRSTFTGKTLKMVTADNVGFIGRYPVTFNGVSATLYTQSVVRNGTACLITATDSDGNAYTIKSTLVPTHNIIVDAHVSKISEINDEPVTCSGICYSR